jgi:hypothetical protein
MQSVELYHYTCYIPSWFGEGKIYLIFYDRLEISVGVEIYVIIFWNMKT